MSEKSKGWKVLGLQWREYWRWTSPPSRLLTMPCGYHTMGYEMWFHISRLARWQLPATTYLWGGPKGCKSLTSAGVIWQMYEFLSVICVNLLGVYFCNNHEHLKFLNFFLKVTIHWWTLEIYFHFIFLFFPPAYSLPLQCHHLSAESSSFISEIFFPETSVYQHQGNIGRTLRFNVV